MDFVTYDAAYEFVNRLKEIDPVKYKEIKIDDVLPYFDKLEEMLDKIRD